MASQGFRMRWWMWTLGIAAVVASAGIALRLHGQAQLDGTQAAVAAIGLAPDLTAWVAASPPVDRERQLRVQRLLQGIGSWPDKPGHQPFTDLQEQRLRPADIAARDAMLTAGRPDAQAMAALLREGPVLISLLGFINRDPAWLAHPPALELCDERLYPDLMACRGLAGWWAAAACLADDPTADLHHLRVFAAALDRPGSLIDAMIAIAVTAMQDQTCLHLATRGRLSGPEAQAWLEADPDHLRWIADGFAGERCCNVAYAGMDMDDFHDIGYRASGYAPTWLDRVQSLPYWCLMPYDHASTISQLAGVEAGLRGLSPPPAVGAPFGMRGIAAIMIPNLLESAVTACEASYLARLHRVAAILALRQHAGQSLPADLPALTACIPARLLDRRDADHPAVGYERLAPNRFRIGLCGGPPPRAAGRWGPGQASDMGGPASPKAWARTRWSLEIDLAAILVPPHERTVETRKKPR